MNRIFFLTIPLLFLFSCSTFVNLGDSEKSYSNGDSLPEELNDNESYENETGDYGDAGNSGNAGDTGNTGNTGNSGEISDSPDETTADEDSYAVSDDEDNMNIGEYPFDDEFTSEDCGCGENPVYEPICCDKNISVFNKCFANCYNINSDGRICYETTDGVCEKVEQPDNEVSDNDSADTGDTGNTGNTGDTGDSGNTGDTGNDTNVMDDADTVDDIDLSGDSEVSDQSDNEPSDDSDSTDIIDNECGCFPNDTGLYCCYVNGTVLVSKCMADCMCAGGYSDCY